MGRSLLTSSTIERSRDEFAATDHFRVYNAEEDEIT